MAIKKKKKDQLRKQQKEKRCNVSTFGTCSMAAVLSVQGTDFNLPNIEKFRHHHCVVG